MAFVRDPGTPLGGERPLRRRIFSPEAELQQSPLDEMDGVAVPETPPDAARGPETDMIRTLASLLDEKLKPLTASNELMQQGIDQAERAGNENMMELRRSLRCQPSDTTSDRNSSGQLIDRTIRERG